MESRGPTGNFAVSIARRTHSRLFRDTAAHLRHIALDGRAVVEETISSAHIAEAYTLPDELSGMCYTLHLGSVATVVHGMRSWEAPGKASPMPGVRERVPTLGLGYCVSVAGAFPERAETTLGTDGTALSPYFTVPEFNFGEAESKPQSAVEAAFARQHIAKLTGGWFTARVLNSWSEKHELDQSVAIPDNWAELARSWQSLARPYDTFDAMGGPVMLGSIDAFWETLPNIAHPMPQSHPTPS